MTNLTDYEIKLQSELQADYSAYQKGKLKVITRDKMDKLLEKDLTKLKQKHYKKAPAHRKQAYAV
jgi:hypothetical protein